MTSRKEKEIALSMMNEADAEEMLEDEGETIEDADAEVFGED
jgi:hypothetical protein